VKRPGNEPGKRKKPATANRIPKMRFSPRPNFNSLLGHFEHKGVVETARGAITVKDREGLEECANGLYGVPETEFERLFAS
jgi:hypothetical protein